MIPQQQVQQPLAQPAQQPMMVPQQAPVFQQPVLQPGIPVQNPYVGLFNAFSNAFDPITDSFMARRPQQSQPRFQHQEQSVPSSSAVQQEEGGLMSVSEAKKAASHDALSPVNRALLAYEKLASISSSLSDAAFTQLAAQIWYENIKTPVDPNIFVPMRTQPSTESGEQSRKRQRDETGRFAAPQSSQPPLADDPQQPHTSSQGSQEYQMPQQQQQQQQQPSMPPSSSPAVPLGQVPMMIPQGLIPPGMQLVPIVPMQQHQQQQSYSGMQLPTPAPIPTIDANKLKQRLGIPIQPLQQSQQQPQQYQQPQQPQQQQPQQPQQQQPLHQQQQQQSVPSQFSAPQQQ